MDDNLRDPEETLSDVEQPRDDKTHFPKFQERRSLSEPAAFFEFFTDLTSDMSHAEDIIFSGKLLPFNPKPVSNQTHILQTFHPPPPPPPPPRSQLNASRLITNSRCLDDRKIRRNSSISSEIASSKKFKVPKPRWEVMMMFGLVKFPPEMDLRDIKSRQVRRRRNRETLFPASFDTGKKVPVNRSGRKSFWGLLRLLSCKDHTSAAVTASFGCMQQV